MPLVITYAIEALNALPALIATGKDVVSFIEQTNATLKAAQAENRDILDSEWDALRATIEDLRAQRPDV